VLWDGKEKNMECATDTMPTVVSFLETMEIFMKDKYICENFERMIREAIVGEPTTEPCNYMTGLKIEDIINRIVNVFSEEEDAKETK
jgi:hypothetical protein